MTNHRPRFLASLCAGFIAVAGLAGAQSIDSDATLAQFTNDHPFAGVYRPDGDRVSRVYGRAFSHGATPDASANAFIQQYAAMLEVRPADLVTAAWDDRNSHHQGAMYDPATGEFTFTVLRYQQMRNGIPVFRSGMRLMVRNEPGYPLVLASTDLRPLGDFNPQAAGGIGMGMGANGFNRAQNTLRREMGAGTAFTQAERMIFAGVDNQNVQPRLADVFVAEAGTPADGELYQKTLFVTDATTGVVLYEESQILHVDVEGNVSGQATEGIGADICGPESLMGLPYAQVQISGGSSAFADENGNFVIPHGGNTQVTVNSFMRGRYFEVFDESAGGSTPSLSMQVTPPGPADFVHNAANTSETARANVNTYLHANIVRDFTLAYNPSYPVINNQLGFDINTNISSNCNAFYNGSSINFYTSGGGCSNTGNSTVVYHEYGHHLVNTGGSGQGAYGEGMSDCVAVIITDSPFLGLGFQNNCNSPLRNADNNCQYDPGNCSSCGSAIHSCGRLISGCVWSTRTYLAQSNPSTYRDIIAALTINSILLHTGTGIDPSITIDFLTLDDDDSDIGNGTPHYQEIANGFGDHNMDAPPLNLLSFGYPDGRPALISPSGGTTFMVEVTGVASNPQPGTGMLHVDTGSGFVAFPMTEITDNIYEATFPAVECGTQVRYYVSAETTNGQTVNDPNDAPDSSFTTISASDLSITFEDDFNTNQGWTVSGNATDGQWERAIPIPNSQCDRGNPGSDFDGSGFAFVTDNSAANQCNSDVDSGQTILTSPAFDTTGGDAYISYARWFNNVEGSAPQQDPFTVQISGNNGSTWTNLEVVGPAGDEVFGGWYEKTFRVSDFITPSSQTRVRFIAQDLDPQSVVEAAVDAFRVEIVQCQAGTELTGFTVETGTLLSGTLDDLQDSDDSFVRVRSGIGISALEPTLSKTRIQAVTTVGSPATIDLSVESRIDQPNGAATLALRNFNTNQFDVVLQYNINNVEDTVVVNDVPAANRVAGNGAIELEIKHVVIAPFSALGFISFFDEVDIQVQN